MHLFPPANWDCKPCFSAFGTFRQPLLFFHKSKSALFALFAYGFRSIGGQCQSNAWNYDTSLLWRLLKNIIFHGFGTPWKEFELQIRYSQICQKSGWRKWTFAHNFDLYTFLTLFQSSIDYFSTPTMWAQLTKKQSEIVNFDARVPKSAVEFTGSRWFGMRA